MHSDPSAPIVELTAPDSAAEPAKAQGTGILPLQELRHLVRVSKQIAATEHIVDDQLQPASLDLRLGRKAYRVRASFLPGEEATVLDRLSELSMHEIDLTKPGGAVLERGCVYVVPLLESLDLKYRMSAVANPKSSTGRLDVFTRLITDRATRFDQVSEQYKGPLYAEISPRTFSVLVRMGSRLNQLRIRRGNPAADEEQLRELLARHELDGKMSLSQIRSGMPVHVDVKGQRTDGLIGYQARNHAGLVDVDLIRGYDVLDFWDPVFAPRKGGLVLDPGEFYILASREPISVPPMLAAEMIAYDTSVGEFRVHYAGFFDPGFGDASAGDGVASRAVLEVRSFEVPFVIEDGQVVGRLVYQPLSEPPEQVYGERIGSSYQGQGISLSKHFRPLSPLELRQG